MYSQLGQQSAVGLVLKFIGTDKTTSLGWKIECMIKAGRFEDILSLEANPKSYTCRDTYMYDSCLLSLIKKNEDWPAPSATERSRKVKAITKFLEGDAQCAATNQRIKRLVRNASDQYFPDDSLSAWVAVGRIRRYIARVLGPVPDLDEISPVFGPGSTMSDKSKETCVPDKLSSIITFTAGACSLLPKVYTSAWGRAHLDDFGHVKCKQIRGNRFFTVPKDAVEARGAAVEPSLNAPFAAGVGAFIKDRQRQAGNDLWTNQQLNRCLAKKGSLDGTYATVDLKNASNTLSVEVVKLLLPDDWYRLLSGLRSPVTSFDGKQLYLSMFSTMGCGFTFELEALIFLAIARESMWRVGIQAKVGDNLSVHGDDVVLPSMAFEQCVDLMGFFGFTANRKKSFGTGPFRESCGGDFWLGVPTRPPKVSNHPKEPHEFISLANKCHKICRTESSAWIRSALARVRSYSLDNLPLDIRRLRGPTCLGDLVVHESDLTQWALRTKHDRFGPLPWQREIAVWAPASFKTARWDGYGSGVQLGAALYGTAITAVYERRKTNVAPTMGDFALEAIACKETVPLRDGVLGYAKKWIAIIPVTEDPMLGSDFEHKFLSFAGSVTERGSYNLSREVLGLLLARS